MYIKIKEGQYGKLYICREKRKPCEYANSNGYCIVTACVKQPEYVRVETVQPWQWMKEK